MFLLFDTTLEMRRLGLHFRERGNPEDHETDGWQHRLMSDYEVTLVNDNSEFQTLANGNVN